MATTEIERLLVRLVGDATSYQKMLKDAKASSKRAAGEVEKAGMRMQRLAVRLNTVGKSMQKLGRQMSLRVTAPLAIIGGLSVRAFAQFDQAITESTSIMTTLAGETERMRDLAISLSLEAAQSPKELAESYFFLASAGKNAEQSMALLPKVMQFATAGAFDMATATDLLTDAQSALGLSSKNVALDQAGLVRVSDVLVKANTLANASVQQFATALTSKTGAALKSYKIDVEEGVAVLAALADQGIKAELAGNALDRVIRLLSKASRDNRQEFIKLGFSVFKTDGSMRNLADIIGNIEDITRDMSVETKSAALEMLGFEARVQGVILPLLGTSSAIRKYEEELRKAKGITQEVSDKQMQSFSNQLKILKNQLTVVGIEIGQILAPAIKELGSILKASINVWRNLNDGVKVTVVTLGVLAATIDPLLILIGSMTRLIGFSIIGFKTFRTTVLTTTTVMRGLLTLGVAAFFIGIHRAVSEVNEELDKTRARLSSLQIGRIQILQGLEGPDRIETLKRDRARLLAEVMRTQIVLREAQQDPDESLQGSRAVAEFFGIDTLSSQKKAVDDAKKSLQDFERTFREELLAAKNETKKTTEEIEQIVQDRIATQKKFSEQITSLFQASLKGMHGMLVGVRRFEQQMELAIIKQKDFGVAHKKTMEEGKRVIEQFLTPQERFLKRQADLQKLFDVGALGKGIRGQEILDRALAGAKEELKSTVERERKARVGKVLTPRAAAAVGSAEDITRLQAQRDKFGPEQTFRVLEEIRDVLLLEADKPSLDEVAEVAGLV